MDGRGARGRRRYARPISQEERTLATVRAYRARFALFFEFRDGRIVVQRYYDCFDSW